MKPLAFLLLFATTTSLGFALNVSGLRCDDWLDPLGIDETKPHLSWTLLSAGRGDRQTAYHILVASSRDRLARDSADLWDTGRVDSEETLGIPYAGRPLHSSEQMFWKVRSWDAQGRASAWSAVGTWTMGVLPDDTWSSRWISAAGAERYAAFYPDAAKHDFGHRDAFAAAHPHATDMGEPNFSSLLARKEIEVKPGLRRAVVHISGLGQYELSLNGQKVGEQLLSPGWTNYRRTVLYDTFEITRWLAPGKNALGIILGNGMYNLQPDYVRYVKFLNSFGPLKVIAQIRLEYTDGSVAVIGTDRTWQVAPGPLTYSNIFGGEDYDARREPAGWDQPSFHPSQPWKDAIETDGPGGALKGLSASAPPIKIAATLTPLRRTQINANTWIYDLGQNASMMPHVRLHGHRGAVVRMIPSELLGPDGRVDRTSATQDGARPAWWQYTCASDDTADWRPRFFYQGARYLQVELFPGNDGKPLPTVESLTGLVVHTSAEPVGEFSCSSELFNRIYLLVRWAQRSNLQSVITDCPQREKLGWLEQYHLNGPSLRYNFDLTTLFRKGMNDMADSQLENGFVPNIAPEFFVAGGDELTNGFRNSPEWGSSFILVAWQQYLFTGDTTLIAATYDRMKRYLAFLDSTADHAIIRFGLGDWYDLGPNPPWGSQLTPVPLTATAIYYYDYKVMAAMAQRIGRTEDAQAFHMRAAEIRAAFNREFYHPDRGVYGTDSQTANALPLFLGLVEPDQRRRVSDAIVADIVSRGNAFTSGDVGYRFLLKALAMEGHSDVIFAMNNQTEKPGYGYQLKMGATSLTEKWDASVGSFGSQNHFMLGQINEWFFHDVGGIGEDENAPGFKHVIIHPVPVGDLRWAHTRYRSVRGPITTSWQRDAASFTLDVEIPPGCTGTVYIPTDDKTLVTEAGNDAAKSPSVSYLRHEAGAAVYEIGSGRYHFVAR